MIPPDDQWRRTDARMIGLTTVTRLGSLAIPVLVVVLRLSEDEDQTWSLRLAVGGAVLAVGSAILSWHATRYRFDATRLQVRRGVLRRTVLTAPLDRIRTVDLEAPLLHRALGLAKVTIGTATGSDSITLDSLSRAQSAELREQLLRWGRGASSALVTEAATTTPDDDTSPLPARENPATRAADLPAVAHPAPRADDGVVLARLDPHWVRYAPTGLLGGAATTVALLAALWGFARDTALPRRVLDALPGSTAAAIVVVLIVVVAAGMLMATGTWVSSWWGATLTREPGGTLHLRRGLMTTSSTTLEEARIRGVRLAEPPIARLLTGASLHALSSGTGSAGEVQLLPTCPRDVATAVGHQVLLPSPGNDPMTVPTRGHGPVARRRLLIRAVIRAAVLTGLVWALASWRDWTPAWPVIVGAQVAWFGLLAELTHRHRGHALDDEHLVVTSGALWRTRVVLQTRGIIGWTIGQTLLQRRAGLATLTAATSAGPGFVTVEDVPLEDAVALVAQATPDVWERVRATV